MNNYLKKKLKKIIEYFLKTFAPILVEEKPLPHWHPEEEAKREKARQAAREEALRNPIPEPIIHVSNSTKIGVYLKYFLFFLGIGVFVFLVCPTGCYLLYKSASWMFPFLFEKKFNLKEFLLTDFGNLIFTFHKASGDFFMAILIIICACTFYSSMYKNDSLVNTLADTYTIYLFYYLGCVYLGFASFGSPSEKYAVDGIKKYGARMVFIGVFIRRYLLPGPILKLTGAFTPMLLMMHALLFFSIIINLDYFLPLYSKVIEQDFKKLNYKTKEDVIFFYASLFFLVCFAILVFCLFCFSLYYKGFITGITYHCIIFPLKEICEPYLFILDTLKEIYEPYLFILDILKEIYEPCFFTLDTLKEICEPYFIILDSFKDFLKDILKDTLKDSLNFLTNILTDLLSFINNKLNLSQNNFWPEPNMEPKFRLVFYFAPLYSILNAATFLNIQLWAGVLGGYSFSHMYSFRTEYTERHLPILGWLKILTLFFYFVILILGWLAYQPYCGYYIIITQFFTFLFFFLSYILIPLLLLVEDYILYCKECEKAAIIEKRNLELSKKFEPIRRAMALERLRELEEEAKAAEEENKILRERTRLKYQKLDEEREREWKEFIDRIKRWLPF